MSDTSSDPDAHCMVCKREMPEEAATIAGGDSFGAVCSLTCVVALARRRLGGFCQRCGTGAAKPGQKGFCDECWKLYESKVQ